MAYTCEDHRVRNRFIATLTALPIALALSYPGAASAGLFCTLTVVGGDDQLAIPGSRLSRPLRVQYNANGVGPAQIPISFSNCEGNSIRVDPTAPEGADFTYVSPPVADGGIIEVLGFVEPDASKFAFLCVDAEDKGSNCFASADFSFDVEDFQLGSPNANPTVYVGQSVPLQVQVSPAAADLRIVWEQVSGGGFLSDSETFTDPGGLSFNQFSAGSAGASTVRAWIGAFFGGKNVRGAPVQLGLVDFAITVLERSLTITGGDNQQGQVNQILPQPLAVQLTASDGGTPFPESGVPVEFLIKGDSTNGASLIGGGRGQGQPGGFTVVFTDGSGNASVELQLGPDPGSVLVCAGDADGFGNGVCFNAIAGQQPPAQVVIISGNNQTVDPGQSFAPLVIGTSPPGVLPPGIPVQFEVVSGNAAFGSDSFAFTEVDSDGRASATPQAGAGPSSVVIRASVSGFDPVQFNLQVRDPIVQTMELVSGNLQATPPGELFAEPLTVRVLRNGAPVDGVAVRWQRIQGTSLIEPEGLDLVDRISGGGGLSSVDVRAGDEGISRIRAAADGFGAVVFDLEARTDVEPPPPVGGSVILDIVSGNNQSGATGTAADEPIVVRLTTDSVDPQPIAGQRIDWALQSGSAVLSTTFSITDGDGRAALDFSYGTPGPISIRAGVSGTSVAVFASATSFQPALSIVSGNNQTGAVGSPLAEPLVVAISPQATLAKGLAGVEVTWTVLDGGGSLATSVSQTGMDGRASNALTLGPDTGINRVQAAIAGAAPVVFTATGQVVAGVGSDLSIVSGNNQTLPTNQLSEPLVVAVLDSNGEPLPNVRLRWSAGPNSSLSIESETTQTGSEGTSSNRVRILRPGRNLVRVSFVDPGANAVVDFVINAGIANTDGLSDEERDIADAIDDVCANLLDVSSPTPEQQNLIRICRGLIDGSGERPDEVREAIREILPDEILTAGRMGLQMGAAQFDNLKARLAALRGGVSGVSFGGLAMRGDNGTLPLGFLDTLLFGAAPDDEIGADFSRWAFFVSGTFGRGEKRVTERESGFKFDNWSLTAGVDYRYSDTLVLGAAAGYNKNDTRLRGSSGSLDSSGYSVSLYSTWYKAESFYLDAVLTAGRNDFDLLRDIDFELTTPEGVERFSETARSSTDGSNTSFAISGGRDFNRGGWTFGPYLRGTFARQKVDGFTEVLGSGTGSALAFRVDDRTLKSRSAVLGGKINYAWSTNWGILLPHFQVEYQREFEDDEQEIIVRLLHDPGAQPFILRGDPIDRSFLNIGLGVSAVFANGRSAFIFYERTSGLSNQKRENIALGLRFEF